MPILHECSIKGCHAYTNTPPHCDYHHAWAVQRRYELDQPRRRERNQQQQRNTAHWRKLRTQVKDRDGHQCRQCGSTSNLTVHLNRALAGNHSLATIDDCLTLCRSCHGRLDGGHA